MAGLVLTALLTAGLAIRPHQVQLAAPGGMSAAFREPFAVAHLPSVLRIALVGTLNGLSVVYAMFMAVVFASMAIRYRAGHRALRQQMKWLALAAVGLVATLLMAMLAIWTHQPGLTALAYNTVAVIALLGIPAAMTIAILRHRLFDIDLIISRAVAYGLLSAAVTVVYAGIVLGIGTFAGHRGGPLLTVASAVLIALVFQPLRHRLQRFANRVVYGRRATPYQALADFAEDMSGQLDVAVAADRLVSVLAAATGADQAQAWIRAGSELRPAAAWPPGRSELRPVPLPAGGGLPDLRPATAAVPVRHGGELLGALALAKPPSEPLTVTDDKLLRHLASQAGLVLRNAALTADLRATIDELRASRRRLVGAQDAERRKIERNLHDGAQQQLVALNIQLSLLDQAAGDRDAVQEITGLLRDGVRAALADLRDTARGIYPPLLADRGLAAALAAQAGKAPLPVRLDAGGIGRYPQETESAVYFCTLEALQNVAKYAGAAQASIRLAARENGLQFTISDDGTGFDPASAPRGSGLQGMADRLAALGGTLRVRSAPGAGTTLTGWLPAAQDSG